MRIVTWNCCGGLKAKFSKLVAMDADVLVIQECLRPFVDEQNKLQGWSCAWIDGDKKGLAVFARMPWAILDAHPLPPKLSGMAMVDGPARVELYPVWTQVSKNPTLEYIEQIHLLLDTIERTPISTGRVVLGDFNSNARWDADYGEKSHSRAVDRFRKLGMESAYHTFTGEVHGSETNQTHRNNKNKQNYHVDYAFLAQTLLSKLKSATVGPLEEWLSFSDHAPLILDLDV